MIRARPSNLQLWQNIIGHGHVPERFLELFILEESLLRAFTAVYHAQLFVSNCFVSKALRETHLPLFRGRSFVEPVYYLRFRVPEVQRTAFFDLTVVRTTGISRNRSHFEHRKTHTCVYFTASSFLEKNRTVLPRDLTGIETAVDHHSYPDPVGPTLLNVSLFP